MTGKRYQDIGFLLLLWSVMTLPLLLLRPLWPIIETRYVAVAWEMWLRHDFLVPYLNGLPYSHKPPLLFWVIHAGWWLFGVNSWWPRIVPSIFTFGTIFITLKMARILWPKRDEILSIIPFMLLGCLLWTFYMTFVMFDLLVAFSASLGMYGLLLASIKKHKPGFLLFGFGIGLGILSKGPVILVILLPVAIVAPWWVSDQSRQNWIRWYFWLTVSLLLGVLIGLAWAIPAARSGGEAYSQALLWKQTANRMVQSFAHQQSWWWYLPLLPLLLFPWSCLPAVWRSVFQHDFHDRGTRFCLAWFFLPLLFFSLISGKQVHYLLPIFPAFVLLVSRLVLTVSFSRVDYLPQVLLFGPLAGVWLVLPFLRGMFKAPDWVFELEPVYGAAMLLLCMAILFNPIRSKYWPIRAMTTLTVLFVTVLQLGILAVGSKAYDLNPLSSYLAKMQDEGHTIANAARYEGQYQFLGRLKQPLEVITEDNVTTWLAEHPDGRVIRYFRQWPQDISQRIDFVQPFRGQFAVVVSSYPLLEKQGSIMQEN
jgi:4-amino-4-deoxy-L-arabinose transferase-like glycosyltransferase